MKNIQPFISKKGFSIIEVMIGVFIFSLGLVAIYALLISSLNLSEYNKNSIIASQLAVEQIEIIRNIRDTNYTEIRQWDTIPWLTQNLWDLAWVYVKVENDFSQTWVSIEEIPSFAEWINDLTWVMQSYRLCLDNYIYTYNCAWDDIKLTPFYRYLRIDSQWDNSLLLTSKVIWYSRGYHEFEIQTLITDWRRL